ncbi:hypothetical protein Pyn_14723 [Prunus yedoensis var. nudiflora]|uniref:Phosphoribosylformimino-5-aminoimidazole carboxamide ribotide isomerase n=1 Tax=Prunus yedoensis var. nudiflora TaxID=2094558 RepID=A0A314UMP9_PRUYE|nr:hypothetical protein Pyn_14723 [Prunus yedoensis var. nudiflora]
MGKVKQIVGSTLLDSKEDGSALVTNFVSDKSAEEYAKMYEEDGLTGGHAIMLGAEPLSRAAAIEALHAYPVGLWLPYCSCRFYCCVRIFGNTNGTSVTQLVSTEQKVNGETELKG